jgi:heptaprenyl diphosphate synthase
VDDLIDIESTKEESGKVAGTDLLAGVPTLPVLLLAKFEDADSKALYQKITSGFGAEELPSVLASLRSHPVMEQARAETVRWGDLAIEAVMALPAGSVREALVAFANAVVDRKG